MKNVAEDERIDAKSEAEVAIDAAADLKEASRQVGLAEAAAAETAAAAGSPRDDDTVAPGPRPTRP